MNMMVVFVRRNFFGRITWKRSFVNVAPQSADRVTVI